MKTTKILAILVAVLGLVCSASAEMVAYYGFEGNANDSAGTNDGTEIGNPTYDAGKYGQAINLDGTDDYVDCGNSPAFNMTDVMTVAAWVNMDTNPTPWAAVVTKGNSAWRLSTRYDMRKFHFAVTGSNLIHGDTEIPVGEWHHVCGTYDGTNIRLYVDGMEDPQSPVAYAGSIATNSYNVCISRNAEAAANYWDGLIDDVRIYDHALDAAQVARLVTNAMGTAFTYQGRLLDGESPADRDEGYDFRFKLYEDPGGGNQVGPNVDKSGVDVIDGYFTIELDFGSDVFDGNARWLEIGVRPGDSNGVYTTLEPRQELTPTPYSLYAAFAGTVNTPLELSGSSADAVIKGSNDGGGSGVYGLASGRGGYGVYGYASNTADEENVGGYFMADGKKAKAVYGYAGSTEDENYGGYFMADGKKAKAVYGSASSTDSEINYGGWFEANAKKARAVYGIAGATDDAENYGGYFQAVGKKKSTAVFGEAAGTEGDENYGGYFVAVGKKKSTAVFGNASSTDDVENYGGYFMAAGKKAKAVFGTASAADEAENYGGYFQAVGKKKSTAVFGEAAGTEGDENYGGYFVAVGKKKSTAVFGNASSTDDVENYGGYFMASGKKAKAVYGYASSAEGGINYGGWFEAAGTYGRGVYGKATGDGGAALYGEGTNGSKAGYFEGEVEITGDVAIGTSDTSSTLNINYVLRLQPLSIAPASPSEGDMYMDGRSHKLMVYDGDTWQPCW